ncbi:MAG: glycosyltransferase family 2 protein [Candidatus Hodarchaeota archaeon]
MVDVSVVIPSLNEAETIGTCIEKVKTVFNKYELDGEIIVADNSDDDTPKIARSLGAVVVTPDRMGYGYAYLYGFKHAKGEYLVIGDADDTYDFMEIPAMLEPLIKGEADFVIGTRLNGKIETGAMPWLHRQIGNPLLTWFLNQSFKTSISDAHCGFRAIKRDALEKMRLRSQGMEFASEMIIEAARTGLKIREVPVNYFTRKGGKSKLSSFSDGWRHLRFMLLYAPTYLFDYPSILLFSLGVFLMASALLNLNIGFIPSTNSMIAGSLLTIVGYQVFFFGAFTKMIQGRSLSKSFTLERGATMAILIFLVGFVWTVKLVSEFIGNKINPPVEQSIVGFSLMILGLQTFFSSFMLSIISISRKR